MSQDSQTGWGWTCEQCGAWVNTDERHECPPENWIDKVRELDLEPPYQIIVSDGTILPLPNTEDILKEILREVKNLRHDIKRIRNDVNSIRRRG